MRLLAARALQFSGLSPLFTIRLDDYVLRFYPTNTSANLWINPLSRFHDLSLFRDYCRPGDTVADVGANIGEVSIVLSRGVGPHGRVFAFEPHPRIFRFLTGNLSLNGCANVTARNLALGAELGTVRMSDDRRDDMNRVTQSGAIEVPCSTLDAELPDGPIAFLKIDVEGFELSVLRGAQLALARTACVNCELIDEHCRRNGHGMGDVIGLLRQSGFQTFVAGHTRSLRRVDASFAEPGAHELVALREPSDFTGRTGWSIH
ncbi:MAG TPA: FkbM family methyltransferase [Vicinamibacterales bacterium]|nr:FkbM family methyltransferase [Vicinamibacterales bacterium]